MLKRALHLPELGRQIVVREHGALGLLVHLAGRQSRSWHDCRWLDARHVRSLGAGNN
jgi:hypothetical protein